MILSTLVCSALCLQNGTYWVAATLQQKSWLVYSSFWSIGLQVRMWPKRLF